MGSGPASEPTGRPIEVSNIADSPVAVDDTAIELPSWQRWLILLCVCWMGLPVIFWSTASLTATPELASKFSTQPENINTLNAGVLVAMAFSSLVWLPIRKLIGRKKAILVAGLVLCACSIGCATAPNLACFASLWVIGGTTGTFFMTAGQTILVDVFEPTVRGTAVGIFLGSCVSANSIAPLIGSAIVTFTSWRVIFGMEAGMELLSLALVLFLVPADTQINNPKVDPMTDTRTAKGILFAFNPSGVFQQFTYPRVLFANLTCGLLAFNQFSLLSSIRHIINPRFNLISPLSSGLFYLAPGVGFLIGSVVGGKFSDVTVRRYIRKRNNIRLPEDRLNSSLIWLLLVLPLGASIYGWSIEKHWGGMTLPIVSSFVYGFGLMASFSSLNTYSGEARPAARTAVISSKYLTQYCGSAASVSGVVRMVDRIGTGWAFSVNALCAIVGGLFVVTIARNGALGK